MQLIKEFYLNKENRYKLYERVNFNNWYYRIALRNKKMDFDFLNDFKNDKKGKIEKVLLFYDECTNQIAFSDYKRGCK